MKTILLALFVLLASADTTISLLTINDIHGYVLNGKYNRICLFLLSNPSTAILIVILTKTTIDAQRRASWISLRKAPDKEFHLCWCGRHLFRGHDGGRGNRRKAHPRNLPNLWYHFPCHHLSDIRIIFFSIFSPPPLFSILFLFFSTFFTVFITITFSGPSAAVLGNHEFDHKELFSDLVKSFPGGLIGSNLYQKDDTTPHNECCNNPQKKPYPDVLPYKIIEIGEKRILFIGLTVTDTSSILSSNIESILFNFFPLLPFLSLPSFLLLYFCFIFLIHIVIIDMCFCDDGDSIKEKYYAALSEGFDAWAVLYHDRRRKVFFFL